MPRHRPFLAAGLMIAADIDFQTAVVGLGLSDEASRPGGAIAGPHSEPDRIQPRSLRCR